MLTHKARQEQTKVLDEAVLLICAVLVRLGKAEIEREERRKLFQAADKEVAELLVVHIADVETANLGQALHHNVPEERHTKELDGKKKKKIKSKFNQTVKPAFLLPC